MESRVEEESRQNERPAARISLLSFFLNLVLALVKIVAGLLGNSYALVADGIESGIDVFSSLITYVGLRIASRPPDENHPYGHGKAETMASVVASVALVIAAISVGIQAFREILEPSGPPALFTLPVIIGVVVLKVIFAIITLRVAKGLGSSALRAEGIHHGSDAFTSFLALVGISIAILAGPAYSSADDWAAFIACFFILFQGLRIGRESLHSLMDTAPDGALNESIERLALEHSEVRRVDLCRIRPSGYHFIVEIHIQVDGGLTVSRGHDIAHEVKESLRKQNRALLDVIVHIEPFGS